MHDHPDSATTTPCRDGRPPRRRARTLVWAAAIAVVALFVAGCGGGSGGPGVARAGSSKSAGGRSSSATGSKKASALAYSKCMRAHGVADFPDPNSKGQLTINNTGGPGSSDLDPNNAQFQAAHEACKSLGPRGTPGQQLGRRADALKFAKCMRDHGIPDFPDPNNSGGIEIKGSPGGGGDLDPTSPQFQSAQKACKHLLPGNGKTETQTQTDTPQ
jgi:hypothetical protein